MDYVEYQKALRDRVGLTGLPFPAAEYDRRREAVRAEMDATGIDVLLVTDPSDLYYLTGYYTFEVSVHCCLVLGRRGTLLQVPSIETGPAVTGSRVDAVIGYRWEGVESVVEPLVDAVTGMTDGVPGTAGLDKWQAGLRTGVADAVRQRLDDWAFVDAGAVVDRVRIVKSAPELEMLRESARITRLGADAATDAVQAGATDNDVAAAAARAMLAAGSEFMSMQPIVTAGWRSSVNHTTHRRNVIQAGEPVFIELGSAWQRYTAPLMRTVVAGHASSDMHRVHAIIESIHAALAAAMVPGETFDSAARAAERALAPIADEVYFSGVYGYSVGAQFPPSWVEGTGFIARGEDVRFQENMVFHLPLCLRVPGQWGIGVSDTVRIGAGGPEPLTDNRRTLIENG